MEVNVDNNLYSTVADAFVEKFVDTVIRTLENSNYVDIVAENLSQEDSDFIYDLCFFMLAAFEDHGGFSVDGKRYVAHCLFAKRPRNPHQFLASSVRVDLHGSVDDFIPDMQSSS